MRLPNKQTAINGLIPPPPPSHHHSLGVCSQLFINIYYLALIETFVVVIIDTNLQFPRLTSSLIEESDEPARDEFLPFIIQERLLLLLPETTNRQSEIDEDPPIFAL
jgi:hypothetical protein